MQLARLYQHSQFLGCRIPDDTCVAQRHRKIICFMGAEINNLTVVIFIKVKINFNHGGSKWAEAERAHTIAGKCMKCLQILKVQAKLYIYTHSIWPTMDDFSYSYIFYKSLPSTLITGVLYTSTRRAWTSLNDAFFQGGA